MPRHFLGFFQKVAFQIMEAPLAGTKDDGGNQGGEATDHMNDSRSCEIDATNTAKGSFGKGRNHAIVTPDGVYNDRVDEAT